MVFGPWMVQEWKPRRRNLATHTPTSNSNHNQPSIVSEPQIAVPNILTKSRVVDKRNKNHGQIPLRQNRFEAIADLMEEETNLLGSNKGKDVLMAGDPIILCDFVAPMDATTTPGPKI